MTHMQYTSDTCGCKHTHVYATLTDIYPNTNRWCVSNTVRPRQNGHNIVDDIFTCLFERKCATCDKKFTGYCPLLRIRIQFYIMSVLVQIMAWHRTGDKPIILTSDGWSSLLAHICVTLARWVAGLLQIHFSCQKTDSEIHLTKINTVNSNLSKQTKILRRRFDI